MSTTGREQWQWATVIVDASYCPATGLAAWAAWIAFDGGRKTRRVAAFKERVASSTEAEVRAALNGLFLAQSHGAEAVTLQSDCMDVAGAFETPTKSAAFTKRMSDAGITALKMVRMKHVKGHTAGADARHWCNNWCDKAARERLRQLRQENA